MTFSTLEHYMTEVKSNIELCFGLPSTEKCEKNVNDLCIKYGYTYEEIRIIEFKNLLERVLEFRTDYGSKFPEPFFSYYVGEQVATELT